MRKNDRRAGTSKAHGQQLELRLALHEWVAAAGLAAVMELLERERAALCGMRYRHNRARSAFRGGHVPSSLVLGGRRVAVHRPRVRGRNGRELTLPSWAAWSARDPLTRRAMEQMLVGSRPATTRARWRRCRRASSSGRSGAAR